MQCRAGLLDLLGELCLPVLQQIEMLLQQADRLFAGEHVIFRSQHVENAADLGNRHAEPAQRQDVLEELLEAELIALREQQRILEDRAKELRAQQERTRIEAEMVEMVARQASKASRKADVVDWSGSKGFSPWPSN